MNWSHIRLILGRELRDQLRDRRTLFMILVVPLLLYPLLAMSFFHVSQFTRQREMRVLLVGAPEVVDLPALVADGGFAPSLLPHPLLRLTLEPSPPMDAHGGNIQALAREQLSAANFDVVISFPPEFAVELTKFRGALLAGTTADAQQRLRSLPNVDLFPNLAKDSSRVAHQLVAEVLQRWRTQIGECNLRDRHVAPLAVRPFELATRDVADNGEHEAVLWSKILPLVLVLWALTGAFCPAIDLCAGERERGTLETLLCGPAGRSEIVWGKLLTVAIVSMATALVNLSTLGLTGAIVLRQFPEFGPPPWIDFLWLTMALVPLAILFSALCLALAALARSTKEGQYYLMPLLLVAMPLTILPMAPHVELSIGTSLIPVTGMVLLLRSALEGDYLHAVLYAPLVAAVTLPCCWLAIRWATRQFENETVLFRDAERWNLWLWLRSLVRDRKPRPSIGAAIGCGIFIVTLRFLLSFLLPAPDTLRDIEVLTIVTQLFVVALPALVLTILLCRQPRRALSIRLPRVDLAVGAIGLAIVMHPLVDLLQSIVTRVWPLDEQMAGELNRLFSAPHSLLPLLLVFSVLPAICEELAFRGFVLSGLRTTAQPLMAIVVSSLFFAATHAVFQQSVMAAILGLFLGFMVVESGSLLPAVLFHATHNVLGIYLPQAEATPGDHGYWLQWFLRDVADEGAPFRWPVLAASLLASGLLLARFRTRVQPTVMPARPATC